MSDVKYLWKTNAVCLARLIKALPVMGCRKCDTCDCEHWQRILLIINHINALNEGEDRHE